MKTRLLSTCLGAALALGLYGSGSGFASAQNVLKGAQVTESALIDALALEQPQAANEGKTRGFRPATGRLGEPVKTGKPHAGKASLLITFPTSSADLTGDTQLMLDTLARALESDQLAGFGFRVEGHADARGESDTNLKLSQLRAEAVTHYLVSRHQILPERLTAVGKGASEPMNKHQIDAPENRRVTIVTVRN